MAGPSFFYAVILSAGILCAQIQDNRDQQLKCQSFTYRTRVERYEIREKTVASLGRITIGPNTNGSIAVKGWSRNDVLVRSKVQAFADTDAEASALLPRIHTDVVGDQVTATGPQTTGSPNWSVSYEIFVPHTFDLKANGHNGGITVTDIQGRIEANTTNGGLHLTRVSGDVVGRTTNGGIHLALLGSNWPGRTIDLKTTNGGVTVEAPASFSGHLRASTTNGGVHTDFHTPANTRRSRSVDLNIGSGAAQISLVTTIGGIRLKKVQLLATR